MMRRLYRMLVTTGLLFGFAFAQAASLPWSSLEAGRYQPEAVARLANAGYVISPARVIWYTGATPPPGGTAMATGFYVNNPLTIYGGIELPTGRNGSSKSDLFQLDGDSAFAIFGSTPPPITYYSFTMNEFARYRPDTGQYVQTNSSIALSVNNVNIGTSGGQPFNANFVVIVAAKFSAAQAAREFFVRQGVPAASVNTILMPHRFTKQSNSRPPTLNFLTRLTYRTQAEIDAINAFIQRPTPPMKALFFRGPGAAGDVLDSDLVQWETLLRNDRSEFENNVAAGLDVLASRVMQHYSTQGFQIKDEATESMRHIEPNSFCRDAWHTCNYDAPDALYGGFYCNRDGGDPQRCTGVLPDTNSRAVIVGLNHHRYGQDSLMTYFSYSITRLTDLQGIATLPDLLTLGSAAQFLPDFPNPDDYFVITVSRDCTNEPHCLEVPYDDQPGVPGLPKYGPVEITTRVYLDKVMGTAPNPANFQGARLFWIKR